MAAGAVAACVTPGSGTEVLVRDVDLFQALLSFSPQPLVPEKAVGVPNLREVSVGFANRRRIGILGNPEYRECFVLRHGRRQLAPPLVRRPVDDQSSLDLLSLSLIYGQFESWRF